MWQVFVLLYLVATLRGQATYWLARLAWEQADRRLGAAPDGRLDGVRRWLQGDSVARGRQAVQRWGLLAVPFSYLTVGFQTLVLAAAGVLRVAWLPFTLVQAPGALAWALIYTTIGWAAWEATLAALAGRPLALAALASVVLVVLATRYRRRRRRRRTLARPARAWRRMDLTDSDRLEGLAAEPADCED